MKRLSLLFFVGLLTFQLLQAQSPQGINYQFVFRDANGVVANQAINLLYAFEDANAAILYEESQNVTTNAFGLVNVVLGEGTPIIGSFDQVDWSQGGIQFEIEVTYNGTIYSLGRTPLKSVAYSLFADEAGYTDSTRIAATAVFADSAAVAGSADMAEKADSAVYATSAGTATSAGSLDTDLILLNGSNGNLNLRAGTRPSNSDAGYVGVADPAGSLKSFMTVGNPGSGDFGFIVANGQNGNFNARITSFSNDPNTGSLLLYDPNGLTRARLAGGNGTNTAGKLELFGEDGSLNFFSGGNLLSTASVNQGGAGVYDSTGTIQAGMYVDANGDGVIFGDVKNFRIPHPQKADKEIWYASLEGPEAAAYVRGTAQLVNGEGIVNFPEHFSAIANSQTMTVVLTPLSADSEGMAVVEKTAQGFKVKELRRGTGNYSFDWEVKAVRTGYENYRPVRDASEYRTRITPSESSENGDSDGGGANN